MRNSTHVVYEFWGANQPLYVGVTCNFTRRLKEHRAMGYTMRGLTHVRLSFFQERKDAEAYECQRIRDLRPRHNLRDNPDYRPLVVSDPEWVANCRDWRQVDLDATFRAREMGPTPSFSDRQRRMASFEFRSAMQAAS